MMPETMSQDEFSSRMESFAVKCDALRQATDITPYAKRALKSAAATFRRAAKKSPQTDQPSINGSLGYTNGTLVDAWRRIPEENPTLLDSVGALLCEMKEFREEFNRRKRKSEIRRTGLPY